MLSTQEWPGSILDLLQPQQTNPLHSLLFPFEPICTLDLHSR